MFIIMYANVCNDVRFKWWKRFQKLAVIVTIAIKYDWYAFMCEEKVVRHISQFTMGSNHLLTNKH